MCPDPETERVCKYCGEALFLRRNKEGDLWNTMIVSPSTAYHLKCDPRREGQRCDEHRPGDCTQCGDRVESACD
jgi:hypothetical protein